MGKIYLRCMLVIVAVLLLGPVCGCAHDDDPEGEFAIYLPAQDITIDQLSIVSHIEIEDDLVISLEDIISYSQEKHEIQLAPEAYKKFVERDLPGKPFVVCIDREPIYAGAFMAMHFSRSFDGVVIMCPLTENDDHIIRIQLGYPELQNFFTGQDPRLDHEIIRSLEAAGKLK